MSLFPRYLHPRPSGSSLAGTLHETFWAFPLVLPGYDAYCLHATARRLTENRGYYTDTVRASTHGAPHGEPSAGTPASERIYFLWADGQQRITELWRNWARILMQTLWVFVFPNTRHNRAGHEEMSVHVPARRTYTERHPCCLFALYGHYFLVLYMTGLLETGWKLTICVPSTVCASLSNGSPSHSPALI